MQGRPSTQFCPQITQIDADNEQNDWGSICVISVICGEIIALFERVSETLDLRPLDDLCVFAVSTCTEIS